MSDVAGDENGGKRARVQLQPTPTMLGGGSSGGEDQVFPVMASRPFAILLRLRVAQIVAGIVTILLGVVACLEDTTRATLGLTGIPAGFLTVIAAVFHIRASRKEFRAGLLGPSPLSHHLMLTRVVRPFAFLQPWLPTLVCVLGCSLLLTLASMSIKSSDNNKYVLGWLQTASSLVILITEFSIWTLRRKWAAKRQQDT